MKSKLPILICVMALLVACLAGCITAKTATITFDSNGGSSVASMSAKVGDIISPPSDPTKDGYEFEGWYSDAGLTNRYMFGTMGSENITLYAKWAKTIFTITLVNNDGSSDTAITFTKDSDTITLPTDKTRAGYTFGGWYDNEAFSGVAVTSVTAGSKGDRKYYAKWDAITYNITYVGNGGDASGNPTSVTYNVESEFPLPTNWKKDGYTFAGWYETATFDGNKIESIARGTTGDKTFYAKWVEDTFLTHIVTLNGNGGTGTKIDSYKTGTGATLPMDWVREGYEFGGWYESADFSGSAVTTIGVFSTGDRTFYAKWIPNEYTIKFDTMGGDLLEDLVAPYDSTLTLPEATMVGKAFAGWYTDSSLSTKFEGTTMPLGGTTLYAKYVDGIKVSYISLGNEVKNVITTGNVSNYDIVRSADNEPDYIFGGWYTSTTFDVPYDFNQVVTRSVKIYAKWTHRSYLPYRQYYKDNIKAGNVFDIANREEFVRIIDYAMVEFDTREIKVRLKYMDYSDEIALDTEIQDALNDSATSTVHPFISIWTKYYNNGDFSAFQIKTNGTIDGTLHTTNKDYVPVTYPNNSVGKATKALHGADIGYTSNRDALFEDFKYNEATTTMNVSSSNELFYAMQYGIKPICKAGSQAEKMMKEAKKILREIIDDRMTDVEKTYAIYNWFINEVYYDHLAAHDVNDGRLTYKYKAWQMEGVFEDRLAVCDGISKAFVVLARIEGIPTVRVVGKIHTGKYDTEGNEITTGHAWNRVYLDLDGKNGGEWYGVDCTWANIGINMHTMGGYPASFRVPEYEAPSMTDFLFTDQDKLNRTAEGTNHMQIKAETTVDKYRNAYFYHNGVKYDLVMDNADDVKALVEHMHDVINRTGVTNTKVAIDIKYASGYNGESYFNTMVKQVNSVSNTDMDLTGGSTIPSDEVRTKRYVYDIAKSSSGGGWW